jgi:hypothetical protein
MLRYVGDEETRIILLDSTSKPETTISDEVIEVASFQFRQGHPQHMVPHDYVVVTYFRQCTSKLCEVFKSIM